MPRSAPTAAEPGVAIVGGAGALATEALTWMIAKSGNRVIATYPDRSALEAGLAREQPAMRVAIVDADDPAAGPAAVAVIKRARPEVKVLLLCQAASRALVRCAVEERLEGIILQSDGVDEVMLALRHVLEGRAVMPAGWHPSWLGRNVSMDVLSARERDVLSLAARGMSNKEIGAQLVISVNTVKFHLRRIYSRLGVRNRVQATQAACESGEVRV